ncbi:MAG: aminodeoxychorismate/anthranilate synthase component II, partial [Bacteroidales bacterium]|nr:aminodeoxychorismate/anthranilate synthase component II [Bacteroidales bacterium]
YGTRVPVFGVCLGMQAIAEVYGGSLRNLPRVFHGVEKEILITGTGHRIFRDIPQQFMAGRYHSWIVNSEDLPGCLNITAVDRDGEIMALAHSDYDICGVQFHPESILTPLGEKIMRNWLGM